MQIYFLEYRIIYTPTMFKNVFSTSEEREKYITDNKLAVTSGYMYRQDFFINSQTDLINMLKTIL